MGGRGKGDSPQRSCIACRKENDKASLIRFVLGPGGEVVPDLEHKLPGRGAYTCVSRSCVLDAVKKRQFSRAFKGMASQIDSAWMDQLLVKQMEERIGGYLALATKAGATVSGGEALERLLKGDRPPLLLILAVDLSETIAERLKNFAARAGVIAFTALDKETLGILLGKGSDRSAVAVTSQGFASSLVKEINRYRNYIQEESGQ